jgi:glycosyltransferase involved in cell wall biosynthesis
MTEPLAMQQDRPRFSVLMSVYVREQAVYLEQCLESLRAQTLPADEIIVVEDGPLTGSLLAVLEHFEAYLPIRRVKLDSNVGLGRALQQGLEQAAHELVARMDSDDVALERRFELQMATFAARPELSVVGGQIDEFSQDPARPHASRRLPCEQPEIMAYAKTRNPFNHMAVMYRRSSVLAVGGYQHMMYFEDYWLWVRMLQAGHLTCNLPETLVLARADQAMSARRGGWAYLRHEWLFLATIHRTGFQPTSCFVKSVLIRSLVRLIPNGVRSMLYARLLRQKVLPRD